MTSSEHESLAAFLAPGRLDPRCAASVTYCRNPDLLADLADHAAKADYREYIASEAQHSRGLLAAASSGRRVEEYVQTQAGQASIGLLDYENLARFNNGNQRPHFAPLVYLEPHTSDLVTPERSKPPHFLELLAGSVWCANEWPGLVGEWLAKPFRKLRVRAALGAAALAR